MGHTPVHERRSFRPGPLRGGAGSRDGAGDGRAFGRAQAEPLDVVRVPAARRARLQRDGGEVCVRSLDEARAYRTHPVLGTRLVACTKLVLDARGRDAHAIFGSPDDLKFRSSMTLFAEAAPREAIFQAALDRYFGGEADARTLQLLNQQDRRT